LISRFLISFHSDIREEIEKERRTQENLLKEMKQYHSAESSNSDKSNNNKTRR
jgi:hypothetical protein